MLAHGEDVEADLIGQPCLVHDVEQPLLGRRIRLASAVNVLCSDAALGDDLALRE
jgi:hypothetical protein